MYRMLYAVAVIACLSAVCWGMIEPGNLRCEYRRDPLGIDVLEPRLSWIVTSSERSQVQSAYRILVSSTAANLKSGKGDLWDSGKVASGETAQIVYGGKPLTTGMQCYWKVMVWDGAGKASGWSWPAMWSMGLLKPSDFRGVWIGLDSDVDPPKDKKNDRVYRPCPYLRKDFITDKSVKRAMVYATALGVYELRINGKRVGNDYLTPGWTEYKKRVHYQTYDVTDLVRAGRENAIGMILSDGWYAGNISNLGQAYYGWQLRGKAQLVVEYADGDSEVVVTDGSWKASYGPIIESDMQGGETYDSRMEMPGWDKAGFDDGKWQKVDVTQKIDAKVEAYPSSPTRRFQEIKPVSMTQPAGGVWVFNMGTNFAGFVRLKVKGKAGDKVQLRFAERLNPDGTIYTENLRSARVTDTYICRGGSTEVWEPQFTFHGFQYVEVTGYPGKIDKDAITGVELTADTEVTMRFATDNVQANRLYRNICQTQRANFIEIPTDCPQRDERMGWTGDAQIYVRTATYNTDVSAFMTKWMIDVEDGQYDNGGFPAMAPRPHNMLSPAWADAGVIVPWTMYKVYGDTRIIERHYEAMARWIEHCRKDSKVLVRPEQGFGDWLSIKADTPKDVLSTAYFARSTALMAEMAEAVGKKSDAAKYKKLFADIKAAFNKAFVAADGRIKGNTQTVYVLAIAFDLLGDDDYQRAVEYLAADIESRGWHLSTGFIGTKDLMGALTKIGRLDIAYRLFNNDTFPSWGFSIVHGATSIWERWNGWTPEEGFFDPSMNSFAHYSFGAVAEWMYKVMGGIDTDGVGFGKVIIKPRPGGDINRVSTSYKSIRGWVVSDWRLYKGIFTLRAVVPANTSATIHVPAASAGDITEGGKAIARSRGVKFLRMEDGAAVFQVGSGEYNFVSKSAKSIESAGRKLTYVDLVEKLYDLESLATLPFEGEECKQFSSYDRRSMYDEATGEYLGWEANSDGGGFVRQEGDDYVMAEMDGPGVIWRIWSALAGDGHVKIYLDGATEPVIDLPFKAYFDGSTEPFTRNSLVHETAKGLNCYVPIPFNKSCKIVAEKDWGRYYHFTYSLFPNGTKVPTFDMALSKEDTAALDKADTILKGSRPRLAVGGGVEQKAGMLDIASGGKVALFASDKPGAITYFALKPSLSDDTAAKVLSKLWIRVYWDDEENPSVSCPLGDFFGTAPGVNKYSSLPLGVTDDTFYCCWYMPFAKARVELINKNPSKQKVGFDLRYKPAGNEVAELGRFHAWWHRDADLDEARKIDWTMLKAKGRGRYCGVMLHVWNPKGGWWGEGDEKFFVDGEKFPSTFGTGSEDYFGYAWCYPELFENCFHNQTISQGNVGHISVNRWHVADNVPFHESFEGAIEKYYPNSRPTLYSCVAYWYQAEPHRKWDPDPEAVLKKDADLEMFVFFQTAMEFGAGDDIVPLRKTYQRLKTHALQNGYVDALNLRMARAEKVAGNDNTALSIIAPSMKELTEPFVERVKAADLWAVLPVPDRTQTSFKPYLTDNEDGSTKRVTKAGRRCITTRSDERRPCIYFALGDGAEFRDKDRTALITITYYYDGSPGSLFQLQYDSHFGDKLIDMYMPAEKNAAPATVGWHTTTITCPRARFIGRQNARSDFRLISQGEGELFVSDIRVKLAK